MNIGHRIRVLRENASLSQERLAELSKTSRETIAAMEQNRRKNPRVQTLIDIVSACNAGMSDLFPAQVVKAERTAIFEDSSGYGENVEIYRKLKYVLNNSRRKEAALIAVVDALYREVKSKEKTRK